MKPALLLLACLLPLYSQTVCSRKITSSIAPGSAVLVYRNGLLLCSGTDCNAPSDYTVSGTTYSMSFWEPTDLFQLVYQHPNATGQWAQVRIKFSCAGTGNAGVGLPVKAEQLALPPAIPGPQGLPGIPGAVGPQGPPGPVGLLLLSPGTLATADTSITVDLNLQVQPGLEPAALQWFFLFDPNVIASITAAPGSIATAAGKTLTCASPSGNVYACVLEGLNQNTMSNGQVAQIAVTLAPGVSSAFVGLFNTAGATPSGSSDSFNGIGANFARQ